MQFAKILGRIAYHEASQTGIKAVGVVDCTHYLSLIYDKTHHKTAIKPTPL
jgi:hypothetical protein